MPLSEDRLLLETFYFWTRLRYVASALNKVFTVLQLSSSFLPASFRGLRAYRGPQGAPGPQQGHTIAPFWGPLLCPPHSLGKVLQGIGRPEPRTAVPGNQGLH